MATVNKTYYRKMKNIIKQTGNDLNNLIIRDNHLKKAKMILFLRKEPRTTETLAL